MVDREIARRKRLRLVASPVTPAPSVAESSDIEAKAKEKREVD